MTALGQCDICGDRGYWISREGAEIPCEWCTVVDDPALEARADAVTTLLGRARGEKS